MRSLAVFLVVLLASSAGCGPVRQMGGSPKKVEAPPPPPPPPPPPKRVKLAVLQVEKLPLPKVADALNDRLGKVAPNGSDTSKATVSMETALMQLDCAQPTTQCYGQIAKHFEADRLLWAEVEREAKSRKKKAGTIVRVVLFDVGRAAVVGRAEQTFPGNVPNEALDELLNRALSETVQPAEAPAP
jgi:hypothetical protein